MEFFKLMMYVISSIIVSSCGGDEDFSDPVVLQNFASTNLAQNQGCVQGVVVNGLTGQRVDISTTFELIALTGSTELIASGRPNHPGEYFLCNIPVDETFPILAKLDGFENFQGQVKIDSTVSPKGSEVTTGDIKKTNPTQIANIKLYPKNTKVKELKFVVHSEAGAIEGATISLQPDGTNVISPSGTFLSPISAGMSSFTADTDNTGSATFAATELVLGANYKYTIIPPNGGESSTFKTGTVAVGMEDGSFDADGADAYEVFIQLGSSYTPLKLVSDSTELSTSNDSGTLTLIFNRPVELVPGSIDSLTAYFSGIAASSNLSLSPDVLGNEDSESVTVSIEGTKVTLSPKLSSDAPTLASDPFVSIIYQGLQVRTLNGESSLTVPSKTVNYYSTGAASSTPASLKIISGNFQAVSVNTASATPYVVRVFDKDGNAVSSANVRFTASGGYLDTSASGNFLETTKTFTTDADGEADVFWKMPLVGGIYSLEATTENVNGVSAVTFYSEATGAASIEISSGNNQSAAAGSALAADLVVLVKDQSGNPINGETVTFMAASKAGTLSADAGGGVGNSVQTATTNASGLARVEMLAGSPAGTYTVTALINGLTVAFTVTVT